MKKIYLFLALLLTIMSSTVLAGVNVQLNGNLIDFTDASGNKVEAQIIHSRTMVPMRKIFELLNANVEWDGTTRSVTATKGDTVIQLQIDNEEAKITQNNVTTKIQLDSAPVIVDNRTLVPLRFISESLGKQVGWDSMNQTAIIIDYDYFLNRIREKSPLLYELMIQKPANMNMDISRVYTDLTNSKSNTSKVSVNVTKNDNNSRNVVLSLTGNSELFQEIQNEGWSNANIQLTYTEEGVAVSTTNAVLSKMFSDSSRTYSELRLLGKYNDSFGKAIQNMFGVEESKININTFSLLKNDFEKLLNFFTFTNNANSSTVQSSKLDYYNAISLEYIDFTDFDNIIFDNEFIQIYSVLNKMIFNYDVKLNEMFYDYPKINMNLSISKQGGEYTSTCKIELWNDYDEKVVYTISLNEK